MKEELGILAQELEQVVNMAGSALERVNLIISSTKGESEPDKDLPTSPEPPAFETKVDGPGKPPAPAVPPQQPESALVQQAKKPPISATEIEGMIEKALTPQQFEEVKNAIILAKLSQKEKIDLMNYMYARDGDVKESMKK